MCTSGYATNFIDWLSLYEHVHICTVQTKLNSQIYEEYKQINWLVTIPSSILAMSVGASFSLNPDFYKFH